MFDGFENWVEYYKTLDPENQKYYGGQIEEDLNILESLAYMAKESGQADIDKDYEARLNTMHEKGIF